MQNLQYDIQCQDRHYQVKYCVFCGAEIPEDNEDDLYDDEEEDY